MPVAASSLAIVVGAAVAFSALDLLRKLLMRRIDALPLLFYLSLGQVPLFLLWISVSSGFDYGAGYFVPGLASVALNIAANIAFLEAVRISPFSATVPFLSLTPVFTTVLAIPMLGEVPTAQQVVGMLIVVIGALRLNLASGGDSSVSGLLRAFRGERGSVLMVGVALLWSLAAPLDKLAMRHASPQCHGLVLNAGVAVGVLIVILIRTGSWSLPRIRGSYALMGVAVLVSLVGISLVLIGITLVWVGLVETLKRAIGSVLALVGGALIFSEEITTNKIIAVAMMAAGVALVLL